ncbi:MAG TPA: hypothetical protein VFH58_12305 [Acidimicrobiales bacterium]|nr:hypothetical protein [Acidimicrobiales bacterium]
MQLRVPPADPITPVERGAFTLVEEDDVAFSLQLCREVHRIYGRYQDGGLPSTDSMLAGLVVTVEMLAALSRTVREGMPAMRITVAAAQTREMLVVAFGEDPMQKPVQRRLRERYRSLVAESVGVGPGATSLEAPRALAAPDDRDVTTVEAPAAASGPAAEPAPGPAAAPGLAAADASEPGASEPPRRSRFRRLFGRRR